jgi:type I restriction enzyme S subunit
VHSTPPNLFLPDKLWRFVWHNEPKADSHFVRFLFQQPKFHMEISQRASGTSGSMKNISQDKVLTIKTGLPPIDLQREFARRITAVEKLKTAQRTALAELDALFASLQHRAFRGELWKSGST